MLHFRVVGFAEGPLPAEPAQVERELGPVQHLRMAAVVVVHQEEFAVERKPGAQVDVDSVRTTDHFQVLGTDLHRRFGRRRLRGLLDGEVDLGCKWENTCSIFRRSSVLVRDLNIRPGAKSDDEITSLFFAKFVKLSHRERSQFILWLL